VLGYGCVGVFIVVSVVKQSLRVLRQKMLCSSVSVSCMLRYIAGLWMFWCFYTGIICEAFIGSNMAATVV